MSFRTARKLRLAGFSLRPTHQTCSLSTRELCSANSSEKANAARTDKAAKKNILVKKLPKRKSSKLHRKNVLGVSAQADGSLSLVGCLFGIPDWLSLTLYFFGGPDGAPSTGFQSIKVLVI